MSRRLRWPWVVQLDPNETTLGSCVFNIHDLTLDAGCSALNGLMALPYNIRSIGTRDWATVIR
jgi:hypothetical protein